MTGQRLPSLQKLHMATSHVVIQYTLLLNPMTTRWGLAGWWGTVLIFMAMRNITQAIWHPN